MIESWLSRYQVVNDGEALGSLRVQDDIVVIESWFSRYQVVNDAMTSDFFWLQHRGVVNPSLSSREYQFLAITIMMNFAEDNNSVVIKS